MRQLKYILPLFLLAFVISEYSFGQCKNFAKKVCKQELTPFIHDGNYNAAILSESEDAELYKTFYSGQGYRVLICYSDALPDIHFRVMDVERNVLFDNADHNYINKWDFTPSASQQLIVWLKVGSFKSESEEGEMDLASGCVAILFGLIDE